MRIVQALGHDRDQPAGRGRRTRRRTSARRRRTRWTGGRKTGRVVPRRRAAHRRRRRQRAAVGRRGRRRDRGARAVDHRQLLPAIPTTGEVPRRLAAHRRRRHASSPNGFMQITDRAKDVIKSGGEWISLGRAREPRSWPTPTSSRRRSSACPTSAGTSGRWPASCARGLRRRPPDELRRSSPSEVAKWWLPERWAFIDEVPKTSVGKFDKKVLRARHTDRRAQPSKSSPRLGISATENRAG